MNSIGLVLPISRGKNGFFDMSFDTITQIKSNIINLLKTNGGERRMQPTFSGGIYEKLFDQNVDDNIEILKKTIKERVEKWIPGVNVTYVDLGVTQSVIDSMTDKNIVNLKMNFTVNNQEEFLSIDFISPSNI